MKWRNPEEARSRLYSVAEGQSGYFTAQQAEKSGYSRRLQHYHSQKGHWRKIDRGIYRLKDFPSNRLEDLVRWSLWSRGKAVVSHETAASVHELGDVLPARVHLTVDPEFRKIVPTAIVIHRHRLSHRDVIEAEGYRITSPLRTLLDLIQSPIDTDWLAGVVRDALNRGSVRRKDLDTEIARLEPRHRSVALEALRETDGAPRV